MAKDILTLNGLSVGFGVGKNIDQVTKNVSFTIAKGETLALVGESGSGKSVTANAILKLLPKGSSHYLEGTINFDGSDILNCSERELRGIRGNRIGNWAGRRSNGGGCASG